ncbi:glycoside hydrolase family protein [Microscilla marina]|uniref:Glycosyl hydrolase family 32 N-terminal domain-containing protein n=1 Tax=Microscilla marina ATCC 23134 TaxID=313606 RepID=A1ZZB0_MICM2|nr:hypothetical protein [Microscilla marina]EAY24262.1 conserved hypothetical protein [Microscilla marina ATCC 23134]
MQRWQKLGLIYNRQHYQAVPLAHFIAPHIIRIFFSTRDLANQSLPCAIDYDLHQQKVVNEFKIEVPLGNLGMFDQNGIMPTALLDQGNELWMYYIGWNTGGSVPFRNAIGLLISKDGGHTFQKHAQGPLLDRCVYDPCFVASNCVLAEEGFYRMYYLSCVQWQAQPTGEVQHYYHIKYAESANGIDWKREGKVAIGFKNEYEYAISVPRVIKEAGRYKMWYSYRASAHTTTYRIGYAESVDGLDWVRKDELVGLDVSAEGWDSQMICYPEIFTFEHKRYMLYNGNEYGKSGIGLAVSL